MQQIRHKTVKKEGTKVPSFYGKMLEKKVIRELAQERIDELNNDLYIVDINISDSNKIKVEVDGLKGISIKECVSISRNIEHNLDREIQDFELEVTSPGLDQSFKVPEQYLKNVGRTVMIKLNTGEEIKGALKEVKENNVCIEAKKRIKEGKKKKSIKEIVNLSLEDIKETKVVIAFK